MKARLNRLLSLSGEELAVLARAWLALPWIALLLRLTSVPQTVKLVESVSSRKRPGLLTPAQLARLVDAAARYNVCSVHCLPRSLYLRRLLARRGWEANVRIGVERRGRTLLAHAWVEHRGRPVGEDAGIATRFRILQPMNARGSLEL